MQETSPITVQALHAQHTRHSTNAWTCCGPNIRTMAQLIVLSPSSAQQTRQQNYEGFVPLPTQVRRQKAFHKSTGEGAAASLLRNAAPVITAPCTKHTHRHGRISGHNISHITQFAPKASHPTFGPKQDTCHHLPSRGAAPVPCRCSAPTPCFPVSSPHPRGMNHPRQR